MDYEVEIIPASKLRQMVTKRLKANLDFYLVADGHRGLGKSSFLYEFSKTDSPDFTLSTHFVFRKGSKAMTSKFLALPKYEILVSDEGQRQFYSMDFARREQNELWKFLTQSRKANLGVAFATSDFMKLGSALTNILDMRIHVIARGIGVIFWPKENAVQSDKWELKECQRIFRDKTRGLRPPELTVKKLLEIYSDFPTFFGVTNWSAMPAEAEAEYLRLDADGKKLDEVEIDEEKERNYLRFARLAHYSNKTYPDLFPQRVISLVSQTGHDEVNKALKYAKILEEKQREVIHNV
jgi:hypothetical protein